EGDLAGTTIKDSVNATVVGPGAVITGNAEASLDWVSTLAPRVGYAFNNWLVYGKVGGAWAHGSGTATTAINGMQVGSISVDETVSGWMLGIGAEYALWDNWTAKIEYNMMDFGNGGPFADNKFNILKAGINYRFGGAGWRFLLVRVALTAGKRSDLFPAEFLYAGVGLPPVALALLDSRVHVDAGNELVSPRLLLGQFPLSGNSWNQAEAI